MIIIGGGGNCNYCPHVINMVTPKSLSPPGISPTCLWGDDYYAEGHYNCCPPCYKYDHPWTPHIYRDVPNNMLPIEIGYEDKVNTRNALQWFRNMLPGALCMFAGLDRPEKMQLVDGACSWACTWIRPRTHWQSWWWWYTTAANINNWPIHILREVTS